MTERRESCPDPRAEKLHACPGRCRCYVNHYCNPGCTCNSCGTHDSRGTDAGPTARDKWLANGGPEGGPTHD